MKAFMILGAITGFLLGTGFGLIAQTPWPVSLWRASVAALAAAVLARWWSGVWLQGLRDALEQRHRARTTEAVAPKLNGKS